MEQSSSIFNKDVLQQAILENIKNGNYNDVPILGIVHKDDTHEEEEEE